VRVEYVNFSSANITIKRHRNSKTHLKSIQRFHGGCNLTCDEDVNLVVPISDSLESIEHGLVNSSTHGFVKTQGRTSANRSNIKKITIESSRKIAADVIRCVLFLISIGKRKILLLIYACARMSLLNLGNSQFGF
jgi:hypothetical protein